MMSLTPSGLAPASRIRARLGPRAPRRFVITFLAAFLALAGRAQPAAETPEYEVKAAFLYNFGLFVEWAKGSAPERESAFTICVFEKDLFGETLDRMMAGKRIGERPIAVHRPRSTTELKPCAILFLSQRQDARSREVLAAVRHTPVLTVGEAEGFLQQGGILRFFDEGSKIRFEINPEAADAAGLKISSKMLSLARVVRPPLSGGSR